MKNKLSDWKNYVEEMHSRFDVVIWGIKNMGRLIMRMAENLHPMEFYHGMRPYLAGSYNNPGKVNLF